MHLKVKKGATLKINEKVQVHSEVLMDIRSNFVPHKSLKFNYKQPPWLNPKIYSLRKLAKLNHFTKTHPVN